MKTLWKRLSRRQRVVTVGVLVALAVGLVCTARRDLAQRDPTTIRGNATYWKRVTFSPGGAAAYLLIGRRRPGGPAGLGTSNKANHTDRAAA